MVTKLRDLLADIELGEFARCRPSRFEELLNVEAAKIVRRMPRDARHWGIARKVLNIFLRGATYNSFLREDFKLHRIERQLELPLDSLTVKGLKKRSPKRSLPRWHGVKNLSEADSDRFQVRASEIAADLEVERIHLDIYLWLER